MFAVIYQKIVGNVGVIAVFAVVTYIEPMIINALAGVAGGNISFVAVRSIADYVKIVAATEHLPLF